MDQTEEFLATTMSRLREAETALHSGDAGPRMAMWSREDPVTLLGAALAGTGWAEIGPVFQRLGASFSDCRSYENEVIAAGASGDLAYTVAYEHTTAALHGGEPTPYVLRVTTVFRREDGTWKVVHRHADPVASSGAGELVQLLTSGPRSARAQSVT